MVTKGIELISAPNERYAAQRILELTMNKLIVAIALVTPAEFAVAQDKVPDAEARQYRYGDVIDVDKVISQDVVAQSDDVQRLETVKLVYRDHAGIEHNLYYKRIAETHQDS